MTTPIFRYALDPTGQNPDNLVENEPHILAATKLRVFAPTYGSYLATAMVIVDVATGLTLTPNVQWYPAQIDELPSEKYGLGFYSIVVITDQNVSDNITCTYQALGGYYEAPNSAIVNMINALNLDDRPADWGDIINKPDAFPPSFHLHDVGDVYGFEYVVHALDRIRQAIETGDDISHDIIYRYIDTNIAQVYAELQNVPLVLAPTLVAPAADAVLSSKDITLTGGIYYSLYGVTQQSSHFQLAENNTFGGDLIIDQVVAGDANTYSQTGALVGNTQYYWRVKYTDANNIDSAWSVTGEFTTSDFGVVTPSLTVPTNGATGVYQTTNLTATTFQTTGSPDTLSSIDFEIWTAANGTGTKVFSNTGGTSYTVSVTPGALSTLTQYFARVRESGTTLGPSAWSADDVFTTGTTSIVTPSLTSPVNGSTGNSFTPTLTSTAFQVSGGSDTLTEVEFQIWSGPNGTGTQLFDYASASDLSTTVPNNTLGIGKTYYARVQHSGQNLGKSQWSADDVFTTSTASVSRPSIVMPSNGDQGVSTAPLLTASPFATVGVSDTFAEIDWEIWSGPNGTGTLLYSSYITQNNVGTLNQSTAVEDNFQVITRLGTGINTDVVSRVQLSNAFSTRNGQLPQLQNWSDVVYGNGMFSAVGASSIAAYSADGENWVTTTLNQSGSTATVAYGNGVFAAVIPGTRNAPTSLDGVTWVVSNNLLPSAATWSALCYGGGLFVALAAGSTAGATSTPGGAWSTMSMPSTANWSDVVFGNSKFVAISSDSPAKTATSTDGVTWTQITQGINRWSSITFGEGVFVAVTATGQSLYSTDGVSWTLSNLSSPDALNTVAYGNGMFVTISIADPQTNTFTAAYSFDGISWTTTTFPQGAIQYALCFGNDRFTAVGLQSANSVTFPILGAAGAATGGMVIIKQRDVANDWTLYDTDRGPENVFTLNQVNTSFAEAYTLLSFGNGYRLGNSNEVNTAGGAYVDYVFKQAANFFTMQTYTVPSGTTQHTIQHELGSVPGMVLITASNPNAVPADSSGTPGRGNQVGDNTFWLISQRGQNGYTNFSSSNYTTGTNEFNFTSSSLNVSMTPNNFSGASIQDFTLLDTIFGNNLSLSLGIEVNTNTTTLYALSTSDYVNYNQVGITPVQSSGVAALAYGNGLFVVAYGNGTLNAQVISTSPDAITWTSRTVPSGGPSINSVAYGNGLYLAFGANTNQYYSSSDAITWVLKTLPGTANWIHVYYGNGIFFAVDDTGIVLLSSDGITWNASSLPTIASGLNNRIVANDGLFMCIQQLSSVVTAAMSADCINWNPIILPEDGINNVQWQTLAAGGGQYVINGFVTSQISATAYSADGRNWTLTTGPGNLTELKYANLTMDSSSGTTIQVGRFIGIPKGFTENLFVIKTNTPQNVLLSTIDSQEVTVIYNIALSQNLEYCAYFFADDPTPHGIIQSSSFTTDTSGNAFFQTGWEPQFIMYRALNAGVDWEILDSSRGWGVNTTTNLELSPDNNQTESAGATLFPNALGFTVTGLVHSQTYIFLVVRKDNKIPTTGSSVFTSVGYTGQPHIALSFNMDIVINRLAGMSTQPSVICDRLRGPGARLLTAATTAETVSTTDITSFTPTNSFTVSPSSTQATSGTQYLDWFFKRAPQFVDQVCYTGTGSIKSVYHSLAVTPAMMWIKRRDTTAPWEVYHSSFPANSKALLNSTAIPVVDNTFLNAIPNSKFFQLGTDANVNTNTGTYTAYLFANTPGLTFAGSFIGNGGSLSINCHFSNGARWVLIKRIDAVNNWYVADLVAGSLVALDSALIYGTTTGNVVAIPSGFTVTQVSGSNLNVNNGTYAVFAIA